MEYRPLLMPKPFYSSSSSSDSTKREELNGSDRGGGSDGAMKYIEFYFIIKSTENTGVVFSSSMQPSTIYFPEWDLKIESRNCAAGFGNFRVFIGVSVCVCVWDAEQLNGFENKC